MGDRLLKVNDEDVTKMTHQDAVLTLLKPTEEITLTVQHDPLPDNFQVILNFISSNISYLHIIRNFRYLVGVNKKTKRFNCFYSLSQP